MGRYEPAPWFARQDVLTRDMQPVIEPITGPESLFAVVLAAVLLVFFGRRILVKPVGAALLAMAIVAIGIVVFAHPSVVVAALAPDNLPVLGLLILLGGFTWLALWQAVQTDNRGGVCRSADEHDVKFFTWPDLIYSELVCGLAVMAFLIAWSLLAPAPLEEPANPMLTPNPAKAPWYFVGLQEILFYCDGWMAGLAIPVLAVVGLLAIPYLDRNPRGSGYYTIDARPFAYLVFQLGFWLLGVLPIVVGAFFRGPNWGFGARDTAVSTATAGPAAGVGPLGGVFWLAYFLVAPLVVACLVPRGMRAQMGRARQVLLAVLLSAMLAVPLRMVFHWASAGRL